MFDYCVPPKKEEDTMKTIKHKDRFRIRRESILYDLAYGDKQKPRVKIKASLAE